MSSHCPKCKKPSDVRAGANEYVTCPSCGESYRAAGASAAAGSDEDTIDAPPSGSGEADSDARREQREPATVPTKPQPTPAEPEQHDPSSKKQAPASSEQLAELEKVIDAFEQAWCAGEEPDIETHLIDCAHRFELLVELIHLDLEYRLKAGQDVSVSGYAARFPEVAGDREAMVELLQQEYQLREKAGQAPSLAPFLARFPEWRDELAEKLRGDPRPRIRFPIRLNCPHCSNPIAIVDTGEGEEVTCPSCQESFRLSRDETQTWSPHNLPSVGKFSLLAAAGIGAFGTVYRARDTELDREVAIKIPRSGTFSTARDEARFLEEARNVAKLNHVGIVSVHDAGKTDDFPYIVSEFVPGSTLKETLERKKKVYSQREAAELIATISDSLHHAHEQGIVHRDLKPGNIMIHADGHPLVMDFGLAKRKTTEITMTTGGTMLGTLGYMPPEQAGAADTADERSDVYSLGVILFELLTGERPFRGNANTLLNSVQVEEPPRLGSLNNKIARDLETIVAKCLEKSPKKRYQTARDLADDLRRYLKHEPIVARRIGWHERASRWCRRNPVVAGSAAFIFTVLAISLLVVGYFYREERRAHETSLERLRDAARAVDQLTVLSEVLRDVPGAQEAYIAAVEQAAENYERFAEQSGDDNPKIQLDRGRMLYRLGDTRRSLGEKEEALGTFQKAEAVLRKLADDKDLGVDARVEVGNCKVRQGLLLVELDRGDESLAAFENGLDVLRAVLAEHTSLASARDSLASGLANQAVQLFNTGDRRAADGAIRDAIRLYEELARGAPDVQRYESALAQSERVLGDFLWQDGNLREAEEFLDRAIRRTNALQEMYPGDLSLLQDSASTRLLRQQVLKDLGRASEARQSYEKTIEEYELLMRLRPGVPDYQLWRAFVLYHLAGLLHENGDLSAADDYVQQSIIAMMEVNKVHGLQYSSYKELATAHLLLGQVDRDAGRLDDAREALESALGISEQLVGELSLPEHAEYHEQNAVLRSHYGQTLAQSGELEAAVAQLEEAAKTINQVVQHHRDVPQYRLVAAHVQRHLGETLQALDRTAAAEQAVAKSVKLWEVAERDAPTPQTRNEFARFLIHCEVESVRDGPRAAQLASQAHQAAEENHHYRKTLGAAYYRTGQWELCRQTLASIPSDPDGYAAFFVAMTHWELGDRDKSRAAFELAESRFNNRLGNRILQSVRAEATALLSTESE